MYYMSIKKQIRKFIPECVINNLWHLPKAVLIAILFSFPGRKLTVIGVCGTKGKTSTAYLITKILNYAKYKTALFSTAAIYLDNKETPNHLKLTTASALFLHKFITKAIKTNTKYLVLEVSSHALKQYRTWGIPISYVVLTNLMSDHLEYHHTTADYQDTHLVLLNNVNLKQAILNGDDPNLDRYTKLNFPKTIYHKNDSLDQKLRTINLPLLGEFNFYNALAASHLALKLNINFETITKALENINNIPGRLEFVQNQPFKVIVDYAHSVESLKTVLPVVKKVAERKIIVVFGACGDRDPNQRPKMGEVLSAYADIIIITNDDPFTENPENIANMVLKGISTSNKSNLVQVFKILDRQVAIEKALSLAEPNDIVLILGKGAEQWQVFKDKKIPWDDRQITRQLLQKLKVESSQ